MAVVTQAYQQNNTLKMKIELHPSSDRGYADHGWLKTFHNFSFATYFNPLRERFGCLRVLNSDSITGGTGFDLHPHNNMEIITIMLDGALKHRDSMGNEKVINKGEVQVMSAGTGIYHAEFNNSPSENAELFQIWIFPRSKNLISRYDQRSFDLDKTKNTITKLVVPDYEKTDTTLYIQQDAYISAIDADISKTQHYSLNKTGNGTFVMVAAGTAEVEGNILHKGDAIAVSETEIFTFKTQPGAQLYFIEVPMQ